MASVLIPLADGFEEIEALTIVDVLRRGGVEAVTASVSGKKEVLGAHNTVVMADAAFSDAASADYDAIVLPGGGEGTQNLMSCGELRERLVRQKEAGLVIAAICAAPTVLVAAGVIEPDQHVTCYPTCRAEMVGIWVDQPVVEHNMLITSQSPGTAMLFSLVLLKALAGEVVARSVARGMVTDVFG